MDKRFKPMSAQERHAARRTLSEELVKDPSIAIPAAIKKIRQSLRMTIAEYATVCDVATRSLSDIERGKTSPTLATVEKLLAPLGMRLAVLPTTQRDLNAVSEPVRSVRSPNPLRIDATTAWELNYWAKKWDVAPSAIEDAIRVLGSNVVEEVKQYLAVARTAGKTGHA